MNVFHNGSMRKRIRLMKNMPSFMVDIIVENMTEFAKLYQELKVLKQNNKPEQQILDVELKMATILWHLHPVEDKIRIIYPNYAPLFDHLYTLFKRYNCCQIIFYPPYDKRS